MPRPEKVEALRATEAVHYPHLAHGRGAPSPELSALQSLILQPYKASAVLQERAQEVVRSLQLPDFVPGCAENPAACEPFWASGLQCRMASEDLGVKGLFSEFERGFARLQPSLIEAVVCCLSDQLRFFRSTMQLCRQDTLSTCCMRSEVHSRSCLWTHIWLKSSQAASCWPQDAKQTSFETAPYEIMPAGIGSFRRAAASQHSASQSAAFFCPATGRGQA